jgi:hypothetical protein
MNEVKSVQAARRGALNLACGDVGCQTSKTSVLARRLETQRDSRKQIAEAEMGNGPSKPEQHIFNA